MKKSFLILALAVMYSIQLLSQNPGLKGYDLAIKYGKVIKEGNTTFWVVPVTLTNNSSDTLKYLTMTCSWQDFFHVNNTKLKVEIASCDKNFPFPIVLAPGQSNNRELRLTVPQTLDAYNVKFKIGLTIVKDQVFMDPYDMGSQVSDPNNIVWSNEISM